MAMTVTVHRPGPDRTNGGASSHHDRLLVVSKGDRPPDNPPFPVMVLEQHAPGEASLRPLEGGLDGQVGPMAGGNWAVGGADFRLAVADLLGHAFFGPVAIHDRYESQELHDTLAR